MLVSAALFELWKPIPGYEGLYEVSNMGRIMSLPKRGRYAEILRASHVRGYLVVGLHKDGRQLTKSVHRLVLEAFVGHCPEGMEACHYNDERTDNRLVNLRWDTRSENRKDNIRNGRNFERKKTHCPRGHPLEVPNLTNTLKTRGHRDCKACARARGRSYYWKSQGLEVDVQELSDQIYAEISAL